MRKSLKQDTLCITLILFFSFLIQILFLTPPILSDPMEYYFTAIKFPHLPEIPDHWTLRIGLILPVAVLYRIFGNAEITYYSFPLASMAILSIGIYFMGSRLFNRRIGLISALWLITIPSLILESGRLLPDLPATACIVAGFAMLISFKDLHANGRKYNWFFFIAGALFGWSYLIKEYYIIFVLLIPLAFWANKIPYRKLVPVIAGISLMLGTEALFGFIYYDNPFIRLLVANPRETLGFIERDVAKIFRYFYILLKKNRGEGSTILGGIAIIHLIIHTIKKDKQYIFLFSWVLLIYCFFTFTGLLPIILSWEDKVLLRLHIFRYWILILPPLVIGGIAAMENYLLAILDKFNIKSCLVSPILNTFLIVSLSLSCLWGISSIKNNPNLYLNGADHYQELRNYLAENNNPNDVIWVNRGNFRSFNRILPIYTHNFWGRKIWDGTFKYLNTNRVYLPVEKITFGNVIVDRFYFNPERYQIPDYLAAPPENWRLVFESENQRIAIYAVE
ncbi:MAG: glycosyltransferase family 39 protein [Anaerolineaceae bacterium]|nr:glycosyltransferase family 39 protein [Anaerolineaceae bacterium]